MGEGPLRPVPVLEAGRVGSHPVVALRILEDGIDDARGEAVRLAFLVEPGLEGPGLLVQEREPDVGADPDVALAVLVDRVADVVAQARRVPFPVGEVTPVARPPVEEVDAVAVDRGPEPAFAVAQRGNDLAVWQRAGVGGIVDEGREAPPRPVQPGHAAAVRADPELPRRVDEDGVDDVVGDGAHGQGGLVRSHPPGAGLEGEESPSPGAGVDPVLIPRVDHVELAVGQVVDGRPALVGQVADEARPPGAYPERSVPGFRDALDRGRRGKALEFVAALVGRAPLGRHSHGNPVVEVIPFVVVACEPSARRANPEPALRVEEEGPDDIVGYGSRIAIVMVVAREGARRFV